MSDLGPQLLAAVRQLKEHVAELIEKGEGVWPAGNAFNRTESENTQASAQVQTLSRLARAVEDCQKCSLGQTRRQTVFGEGDPKAELVFVGDAPGEEEDRTGRPFSGPAGELLTRMIAAMGLSREKVYICNLLKCRPPGNRNPLPEEIGACRPYLQQQLSELQPKLICALGIFAAQALTGRQESLAQLRACELNYLSIPVAATFHPSALLYHPQNKRHAWEDLKRMAAKLGIKR